MFLRYLQCFLTNALSATQIFASLRGNTSSLHSQQLEFKRDNTKCSNTAHYNNQVAIVSMV